MEHSTDSLERVGQQLCADSTERASRLIGQINEILKAHAESKGRFPYVFGEFNMRPAEDDYEKNLIEIALIIIENEIHAELVQKLNMFGQCHPDIIECGYSTPILAGILNYLEKQAELVNEP